MYRKKIATRSKKRVREQKEYVATVKRLLAIDPLCHVRAPGCNQVATGMHHIQKRSPANWLLESNLLRCCNACNLWIELNPKLAIERGFSKSKFL